MPGSSSRRRQGSVNYWPGFVDALAALLVVVVFLIMVFAMAQAFLSDALSGRDEALGKLNRQIDELARILDLERSTNTELRLSVSQLSAQLQSSISKRDALTARLSDTESELSIIRQESAEELTDLREQVSVDKDKIELQLRDLVRLERDVTALREVRDKLESEVASITGELGAVRDLSKELEAKLASAQEHTLLAQKKLDKRNIRLSELLQRVETAETSFSEERELSKQAQSQLALLNQQLSQLRVQMTALNKALKTSEALNEEKDIQIVNLGQRLNQALATKVQELARYRSEFFGRLREVLGERGDIRIVGDRFVFQSEVLFESGEAILNPQGKMQLAKLAKTLKEIGSQIPEDLDWVLRVDGHTDERPISTAKFPSNWELSSGRAISVVKFLALQGIAPDNLVAAGFGQYQPIDAGRDEIAYLRNRRIEFKLDQR
ncbi:MAG: peptidoglycan -binding protein [Alphaproteobacteria bacterium]|nr:peptidoglycan -binding protein [Alphaproteobacteria bacterium]